MLSTAAYHAGINQKEPVTHHTSEMFNIEPWQGDNVIVTYANYTSERRKRVARTTIHSLNLTEHI